MKIYKANGRFYGSGLRVGFAIQDGFTSSPLDAVVRDCGPQMFVRKNILIFSSLAEITDYSAKTKYRYEPGIEVVKVSDILDTIVEYKTLHAMGLY